MTLRRQVGELGTNAYIHTWEENGSTYAVLVDPGGSGFALARLILERSWKPEAIVLTHGHFDHSAGLADAKSAFSASGFAVPICIHGDDAHYLGQEGQSSMRRLLSSIGETQWSPAGIELLPPADVLLKDGDTIGASGLVVIHCPGHSPGSICLFDAQAGGRESAPRNQHSADRYRTSHQGTEHQSASSLAYTGDTLFHSGVGRTDFCDSSPVALEKSLRRLLDILPPDCLCWPGHGRETHAAAEWEGLFPHYPRKN